MTKMCLILQVKDTVAMIKNLIHWDSQHLINRPIAITTDIHLLGYLDVSATVF